VSSRQKSGPLAFFAASPKSAFKFVVASEDDLAEIREMAAECAIPAEKIYLMPEGTTSEALSARREWLVAECESHGYRFSDRLHIHEFGGGRGV
jgi:hypothetical protein